MSESPDTIHGRMKEGAHLAGYSLQRSIESLRWLLEDSRFLQLSDGYKNVNEFLRATESAFSLANIKPEERKQIAELIKDLQPKASQRAIADMVGASPATIGADLGTIKRNRSVENSTPGDGVQSEESPISVEFSTPPPPAIPPDDYDPVAKEQRKQQRDKRNAEAWSAATEAEPTREIKDTAYKVNRGDIWLLGDHRLMCGDVYDDNDIRRLVADRFITALITDPPYGIDYQPDWNKWNGLPSDFRTVAGDNQAFDPVPFLDYPTVVLFGANYYSSRLPIGGWLCWDKRTDVEKDRMIGSPFELAWFRSVNTEKKTIMARILHGGVVNADSLHGNNEKRHHPTQKPIKLMERVLDELTTDNDVVFDPFSGVGSTLLACERSGRRCMAMEIDPDYVAITLERWQVETGQKPRRGG